MRKLTLFTTTAFLFLLQTSSVIAANTIPIGGGGSSGNSFSINSVFSPAKIFSNIGSLASDIILILTSVAGALSLIFIVIAGIKFITANGDEKQLASARDTITYAIIGLAVTILAFVILQVVQYFLKSSVPVT